MLDEIEKIAIELLGMTKDEVQQVREALLNEVVQDEARYAARTALKHPEGSTTPLNEAADRSQQAYAKIRQRMMKEMPRLLALILSEQVARQQRDEAALARDRHWDAEHERRAVGPHPETRDLFGRLFKHGVTPWHLKALRDEEVAIIADMIRWKANDARHENADTPWRAVIQIYSNRLILKADRGVTVKRSKPGTPVRGKRYTSPSYYMFNEMLKPHWSAPQARDAHAADDDIRENKPATAAVTALEDGSITDKEPGCDARERGHTPEGRPENAALGEDTQNINGADDGLTVAQAANAPIDDERARSLAEAVYAADQIRMKIYWPSDIQEGDYDPVNLIPALERFVASDRNWPGAERFLDAARRGEAQRFIENCREEGIGYLARQLKAGEDKALATARKHGLLP